MTKINKVNLEEFENIKSNIYDLLYIAANFYDKLLDVNNFLFLRRYDKFSKIVNIEKHIFLDSAIIDHFNGNLKISIEKENLLFYIDDKLFDCNTIEEVKNFMYEKLKKDLNIKKSLLKSEIAILNKGLEELCKEEIKMIE